MVKVAIIDVLALMGCEALLHTRKEARPIVVFSIRIGAVVGGNAFGEGECRVPNAYFVRELFGLIVNVITVFRRSNKLGRQSLRLVRYLRDPGMGDQQQRKQDDDYENRNGKAFGKPPRQRTAKHIAKQAACPLQQRHIELLGVGGNRRVKNRADGPEDHEPSEGHMEVLILVLRLAHQTEHHKRQEYRQNHAGQSEQSGGHGMQDLSESALDTEPFGCAEQHRENGHDETCDVAAIFTQYAGDRRGIDLVHDFGIAGTRFACGTLAA